MYGRRDTLEHCCRITRGTHRDARTIPGNLPEGYQDLRIVIPESTAFYGVIDADDLPILRRSELGDAGNQFFD